MARRHLERESRRLLMVVAVAIATIFVGVVVLRAARRACERFAEPPLMSSGNTEIRVINLDKNTERLAHFKALVKASDLSALPMTRFAAVDGRAIDIAPPITSQKAYDTIVQAEQRGYRQKHYELTRGAVGCYLSHLHVYKAFLSDAAKPFLMVFEDDVTFDTDILSKINQVVPPPTSWDVLLLGCICLACKDAPAAPQALADVQRFFLTHAMVLTRSGAQKLVALLDGKPIEKQIDAVISDLSEQGKLKVLCLKRALAEQNTQQFGTTIQIPIKQMHGVDPYDQN